MKPTRARQLVVPDQRWVSDNVWSSALPSWWFTLKGSWFQGNSSTEMEALLEGHTAAATGDALSDRLVRLHLVRVNTYTPDSGMFTRLRESIPPDAHADWAIFHAMEAGSHLRTTLDMDAAVDCCHASLARARLAHDQYVDSIAGNAVIDTGLITGAFDAAERGVELAYSLPGNVPYSPAAVPVLRAQNLALVAIGRGDLHAAQHHLRTMRDLTSHLDEQPRHVLQIMQQWIALTVGAEASFQVFGPGTQELRNQLLTLLVRNDVEMDALQDKFWGLMEGATRDEVTGLLTATATRTTFDAATLSNSVSLLLVGLDELAATRGYIDSKEYHQLLRTLAGRLVRTCGSERTVGRVAETRFVVLDTFSSSRTLRALATRIRRVLGTPMHTSARQEVTISPVIVINSSGQNPPDDTEPWTDASLALDAGRGPIITLTETIARQRAIKAELTQEIRAPRVRQRAPLQLQPIVNAATGRAVAAEALLRWESVRFGQLQPSEVLGNLSADDLVTHELRMIDVALSYLPDLLALDPQFHLNLNFTAEMFGRIDLASEIQRRCEHALVSPTSLRAELTETTALDLRGSAQRRVHKLAQIGVRTVLDDFGVGYSNLSYLAKLGDVDLKIDGSFIRDLDAPHTQAVVKAILATANTLNLPVVAEHVETRAKAKTLLGMGCVLHQGLYYSPAVSLEQMCAMVRNPPAQWRLGPADG